MLGEVVPVDVVLRVGVPVVDDVGCVELEADRHHGNVTFMGFDELMFVEVEADRHLEQQEHCRSW